MSRVACALCVVIDSKFTALVNETFMLIPSNDNLDYYSYASILFDFSLIVRNSQVLVNSGRKNREEFYYYLLRFTAENQDFPEAKGRILPAMVIVEQFSILFKQIQMFCI